MGTAEFAQHEVLLGKDFFILQLTSRRKVDELSLDKAHLCFGDFFMFLV